MIFSCNVIVRMMRQAQVRMFLLFKFESDAPTVLHVANGSIMRRWWSSCYLSRGLVRVCGIDCKSGNFCEHFIFANSVKRHICNGKKIATRACFTFISSRQSGFAISRGIYFHETSYMRSFANIKPSRKFPKLQ